jgi:hypothetical protein
MPVPFKSGLEKGNPTCQYSLQILIQKPRYPPSSLREMEFPDGNYARVPILRGYLVKFSQPVSVTRIVSAVLMPPMFGSLE